MLKRRLNASTTDEAAPTRLPTRVGAVFLVAVFFVGFLVAGGAGFFFAAGEAFFFGVGFLADDFFGVGVFFWTVVVGAAGGAGVGAVACRVLFDDLK